MRKSYRFFILFFMLIACMASIYEGRIQKRNYILDTNYEPVVSSMEKIPSLRVATYNIKTANNGRDIDLVAKDLEAVDADIICFQEVDEHAFRSNHIAMMQEIAEDLGYEYNIFFETLWLVDGSYGIGIISKYPFLKIQSQDLPSTVLEEPRVLGSVQVQVGSEVLQVSNTHLTFRTRAVRANQMIALQEIFQNQTRTLLLGDFNSFLFDEIKAFTALTPVNNDDTTYLTFLGFAHPDNIFYSSDLHVENVQVFPTSFSDHDILAADVYF